MANILIRQVPERLRKKLKVLASRRQVSLNDELVRALEFYSFQMTDEAKKRDRVIEGIHRLHKEITKRYGKFEDSSRLIREDRDARAA